MSLSNVSHVTLFFYKNIHSTNTHKRTESWLHPLAWAWGAPLRGPAALLVVETWTSLAARETRVAPWCERAVMPSSTHLAIPPKRAAPSFIGSPPCCTRNACSRSSVEDPLP